MYQLNSQKAYPVTILAIQIALLWEFITLPTIVFTAIGIVFVSLNKPIKRIYLNTLSIFIFAWYFLLYQKLFDPEAGLNFLVNIIVFKLIEGNDKRDDQVILLTELLMLGAATLFNRTILEISFILIALILLLRDYAKKHSYQEFISLKRLALTFLKIIPLSILFFIFFPRFSTGLWTPEQKVNHQSVGFSDEVSPSEISDLWLNTQEAFHVATNATEFDDLYWRGLTLEDHNNWDWKSKYKRLPTLMKTKKNHDSLSSPYRVYFPRPQRRLFLIETPSQVEVNQILYQSTHQHTFNLPRFKRVKSYQAWSTPKKHLKANQVNKYLNVDLPLKSLAWTKKHAHLSIQEKLKALNSYFSQGFSYSLKAPRSDNLDEFLFTNKSGVCSHFASAYALLARGMGIPSRLVSGYLGGEYNKLSQHYIIRENDAHVWVELVIDGYWKRFDPTSLVAPSRLSLSGARFYQELDEPLFATPEFVSAIKMYLDYIDFQFLVWSEEFDREKQKSIAQSWGVSLLEYYSYFIWVIVLGGASYLLLPYIREVLQRRPSYNQKILHYLTKKYNIETDYPLTPHRLKELTPKSIHQALDNWESSLYGENKLATKVIYQQIKKANP